MVNNVPDPFNSLGANASRLSAGSPLVNLNRRQITELKVEEDDGYYQIVW
jgi:hypothetical protein